MRQLCKNLQKGAAVKRNTNLHQINSLQNICTKWAEIRFATDFQVFKIGCILDYKNCPNAIYLTMIGTFVIC